MAHAIEKAVLLDLAQSERFGDVCTKKAIVLLTDGRANDAYYLRTSVGIAQVWGITLYAIGVDNYVPSELQMIASSEENIFTADTFEDLLSIAPNVTRALGQLLT
uniref:VWFA domain-containing protein n=1 Tax=Ciona savignyi TaxID=51511 RepID=H2YC76_CIOSA